MDENSVLLASGQEWCIRVGEVFDIEVARACLRHCRETPGDRPSRLVFDLSQTRALYTAGIGAMLHLKGCYRVKDGNAAIIYRHPEVGDLLRLVRLDRSFRLFEHGQPVQFIPSPQLQEK